MEIRSKETELRCDYCKKRIHRNFKMPCKCCVCKKDICAKCRFKLSRYIKNDNDTYDGYVKQIAYICDCCINKAFPKINILQNN